MARSTDTRKRARRRELAGYDERALKLYEIALQESRAARDAGTDPGLCVRVADVHARLGDSEQAVEHYREAVSLYVEQGLIPNAVTVLERLLELYPERLQFRRRMVELQLEMGQLGDARTHLFRYLETLRERGDGERAERALAHFGGQFGLDASLRERAESLVAEARERTPKPPAEASEDAAPATTEEADQDRPSSGAAGEEAPAPEGEAGGRSDAPEIDEGGGPGAVAEDIPDLTEIRGQDRGLEDLLDREETAPPADPPPDPASEGPAPGELGKQLADVGPVETPVPEAGEPKAEPEEDRADRSSTGGLPDLEDEELGVRAELEQGLAILDDLLELAPDRLELHRRKVAYARRLGDAERLRDAYLALAERLTDASGRGARLLYERVLELDAENSRALSGLARLDASDVETKKAEGEDAAAGNHPPRMTEATDHQTRQELGEILWSEFEESVRQLPWLDGATQTFQAAGSEFLPPLPAFEMLGRYLLARGKDERAARVLGLALQVEEYDDEDLVDVLFHLSRAYDRLGRGEEAHRIRERVAEADPDFASILSMIPAPERPESNRADG